MGAMKRRALALSALSGMLVFLSFPNFDFDLLAWIALVPLFLALEEKRPGHAFWLGCLQGCVAFLGMIYWIVVAVHTYGGLSLLVSIPVLLLLIIYLALFTGFFAWAIRWTQTRTGLDTLLFAPFLWAAMEYLRSFLLTGFPWGILSYSQYARLPFIQMADITGPYGLSFVIVVVNVAFYRALRDLPRKRIPVRETAAALSCLAVFLVYGYVRLEGIREREAARPSLKIGLAQGNIDQALKWDEAFQAETVRIYEGLTIEAARSKPDLVIWPETATPFFFQDAKQFQPLLFGIAQTTQSYLLFGSPSYRVERG
jgi:apolipoprotein N-acyltransferase